MPSLFIPNTKLALVK